MEKFKVFLSSTMTELHNERMSVHKALKERGIEVICFEGFGARPEMAQIAYLEGVQEAGGYIGIFWNQYSPATEEEYRKADQLGKPCFIYIKDFAVDREEALQRLIAELAQKHTYKTFSDALTLAEQVQVDVQDWIVHQWRQYITTARVRRWPGIRELEMSNQRLQEEMPVHGRLSMLEPLLCRIAEEQGLGITRSSGRPDFVRGNWDFASYIINQPTDDYDSYGHPVCKDLGTIQLQGLPNEKTLITFVKTARGKLPEEEAQKKFEHFCIELIQRLVQLGFLEVPPPPKRKFGFVGED